MNATTAQLAILFADISGSSQLYEDLGDITGRHTVSECLDEMSRVIHKNNGIVIKTIGDEIMCSFPNAEAGAQAACDMHKRLSSDITGQPPDAAALSIRVGLHFGPAILEGGDVYGNTVIVAARMASLAKADQIITSFCTVEQLSDDMRFNTRLIDRSQLKGKKETFDIYELNWQTDITDMSIHVLEQEQNKTLMRLSYKGREILLNEKKPSIILGRSRRCDLPIEENLASREHVKLEYRRGKYFITDISTNGTYVFLQDGAETFLRREALLISGSGEISLGRSYVRDAADTISYVVEDCSVS